MLRKWLHYVQLGERLLVAAILLAVILIAGSDVLLRLLFAQGLSWSAPILKIALLWLSLLGAILAAAKNEHIRIDVLEHYLPLKYLPILQRITALFSSLVCMLIAYHAYFFVAETYSYQDVAFASVPAWVVQAIIPISFALIGLRFFLQIWQPYANELDEDFV